MVDINKLNETLDLAEGLSNYTLKIITGRDRDSIGVLQNITIKAENDLDALLQVFKGYDLQNAGMFNGEYTDEDLTEEDKQLKEQILACVKENKIQEGVKLLTDLYFDGFDPSDYYADIVKLEGPNGVVIEDDIDLYDYEEDEEREPSLNIKELKETCVKQAKAALKELKKVGPEFKLVLDDKYEDYVNYLMKSLDGMAVGAFYIEWDNDNVNNFRIIGENWLNPNLSKFENKTMDGYKEWLLNNFKDITHIKTPQERLKEYEKQIKTTLKPLGLYLTNKYQSSNDGMDYSYSICDVPKLDWDRCIGSVSVCLDKPEDICMTLNLEGNKRTFLYGEPIEKVLEAIKKNYKDAIAYNQKEYNKEHGIE